MRKLALSERVLALSEKDFLDYFKKHHPDFNPEDYKKFPKKDNDSKRSVRKDKDG